jgi:hypothetical protein
MKKQVSTPVIIMAAVVVVAVLVVAVIMTSGSGKMSSEQEQLADLQGQAGNARMEGYVPQNVPGGPESGGGEAAARQQMQTGQ